MRRLENRGTGGGEDDLGERQTEAWTLEE